MKEPKTGDATGPRSAAAASVAERVSSRIRCFGKIKPGCRSRAGCPPSFVVPKEAPAGAAGASPAGIPIFLGSPAGAPRGRRFYGRDHKTNT